MSFIINPFRFGGFAFGNCLQSDGNNDFVAFSNFSVGFTEDYTFNLWMKADIVRASFHLFASGNTSSWFGYSNPTTITVGVDALSFTVPACDTNWNMHTYSRISNTTKVYVNAVESVTGGLAGNSAIQFLELFSYPTRTLGWDGLGDEIAVLKGTGATQANITDLYNGGAGADFDAVMGSSKAYWKLNESGTDTTVVEVNGNYNGTLNNYPASGMWVPHI